MNTSNTSNTSNTNNTSNINNINLFNDDKIKFTQHGKNISIYFDTANYNNNYNNENLIKSFIKTKILLGATITDNYQVVKFIGASIKTLKQFKDETPFSKISINKIANMVYNLSTQLNYLITKCSLCFLGYTPENIIVIDNNKFICISSEYLEQINNKRSTIPVNYHFSSNMFFMSPEIAKITTIPSATHYKTSYYSLAYLIIHTFNNDIDLLNINDEVSLINVLKEFKETKLYWLLKRCLNETPEDRCIIHI